MPKHLKKSVLECMPSKKKRCQNWKLYVITCPEFRGDQSQKERVRGAILGGADVIQLRDKNASDEELLRQAKDLLQVTRPLGVPLIINDRVHVASASGAEGVHLGQSDGSLSHAREILGNHAIFGRSTHSPEQGFLAEEEGFDYIGVGPVFSTPTKPDRAGVGLEYVRYAAGRFTIPFVAIGGIDEENAPQVAKAGARAIAVVRAVLGQEDPRRSAEDLKKKLETP
jgi:thiamine-phosphate pyrophosphorylase